MTGEMDYIYSILSSVTCPHNTGYWKLRLKLYIVNW